jgi:hypothetical protein
MGAETLDKANGSQGREIRNHLTQDMTVEYDTKYQRGD